MIGAEWKKLLRQRWLIGIAILLIFVDVGLFLNTQYTEKKDRVAAVPLFAEYQKETADMTNEQAQEYLTDQLNTLSNFQFVQIALNGEVDEGLLQGLVRGSADGGTNLIRNSYFIGARYLYCFGISGSHTRFVWVA